MSISGTPTGYEQITVTPVDNSIYDATDNEASTSQLMNQAYLHDKVGPTITGTGSLQEDNSTITVSFSDPVYNTSGGSGALEASDFALSISGGVATLSSATPTSIAVSEVIYTLGIGLTGTPNGTETITVTPVANSIYDGAGLVASTSQSNNTATLNDRRMSIKATLEHELNTGQMNSLVRMNLNTYLLAYKGTSNYGYLSTFTIPAGGDSITEVASLQFTGNGTMNYPSVIQMTEDTYIVAYYGNSAGTDHDGNAITNSYGQWISTFRVKPDGSVITKLGSLRHDYYQQSSPYSSLVKVDDDTYALAYNSYNQGTPYLSKKGGWIKTFTVNGGTITQAAYLRHWTSWSYWHSWAQADADTYVLAYMDNSSDGRIATFTIPADGSSITEVAELEYDTDQAQYTSLVKLDSDTYVVAHQGTGSVGEIATFTIPTDGSTITKVTQVQHSDSYGFWNSMIAIAIPSY